MFDTNVTGLINMTQAVLKVFKKRPEGGAGDIINIGSIAGRDGYPGGSIYTATKAAVRILNETCHPKDTLAFSWADDMDPPAEKLRRKYFRTQYRAVEGEVIGLAVKW